MVLNGRVFWATSGVVDRVKPYFDNPFQRITFDGGVKRKEVNLSGISYDTLKRWGEGARHYSDPYFENKKFLGLIDDQNSYSTMRV